MSNSRQLNCYNLGIHDKSLNRGIMCIWPEYLGGRGSNKIGSYIWEYFSAEITDKKDLILWSDNCCGQNKNKNLIAAYMTLIAKGYFKKVF